MTWSLQESVNRHNLALCRQKPNALRHSYGPSVVLWEAGLALMTGDISIPKAWASGPVAGAWSMLGSVRNGFTGIADWAQHYTAATTQTNGTISGIAGELVHYDGSSLTNGAGTQTDPKNTFGGGGTNINNAAGGFISRKGTTIPGFIFGSGDATTRQYAWVSNYSTNAADLASEYPRVIVTQDPGGFTSYIVYDGLYYLSTQNGVFMDTHTAGISRQFIRRYKLRCANTGTGNGIALTNSSQLSTNTYAGIYIEDCDISGFGGYGIGGQGYSTAERPVVPPVIIKGCAISDCGSGETAWGIGFYPNYNAFTSGWGTGAAPIYTRTLAASVTAKRIVYQNAGSTVISYLTANTGTPTTPAAGEFGQSGTTLYIHLPGDANPNSLGGGRVLVSYHWCDSGLIIGNTVTTQRTFGGTDGSGIGLDNQTYGWVVAGNVCRANGGEGLVSNLAQGHTFISNVCDGNGVTNLFGSGIGIYGGTGHAVYNNTVINTISSSSFTEGSGITTVNATVTMANNIIANNRGYGINNKNTSTITETYNCVYNNTLGARLSGSLDATDITINPNLDTSYNPPATLRGTGTNFSVYVTGASGSVVPSMTLPKYAGPNGKPLFLKKPTIGANQYQLRAAA